MQSKLIPLGTDSLHGDDMDAARHRAIVERELWGRGSRRGMGALIWGTVYVAVLIGLFACLL